MNRIPIRELVALAFVVLFCLAAGAKEPRFFDPKSIENILLWLPLITVVAMGEMVVIIARGIDISVGSMLGFSAVSVGLILRDHPHLPLFAVFLFGLVIGTVLGLLNGVLVVWGKLSPLIVTIGTLAAYRGLTFLVSRGKEIDSSMVPDSMTSLATSGIHLGRVNLNSLLLAALGIALLTALFLRYARFGRAIFAYGGNPEAAYLRGLSPKGIELFIYALAGGLSGVAGAMYLAKFGFASPVSAGDGFELTVIAAVAIGGVRLTGGSGSVLGVLLGCLLLSCVNVGLSVLGIDTNWQTLSYGIVILAALVVDSCVSRLRERKA